MQSANENRRLRLLAETTNTPARRYEDAKAASSKAAARIEAAARDLCKTFKECCPEEKVQA